jgi:hypothetical protein
MECLEAQEFVSALHDGEAVPKTAAEHIKTCPACRERLLDYAHMGVELRLLAHTMQDETPESLPIVLPHSPSRSWGRAWRTRMLVPRFALAFGVLAIVGLSVGLGLMRAQVTGLWFQFNVTSPAGNGWGNEVQAGTQMGPGFLATGHSAKVGALIKVLNIQNGLVRLAIRARRFEVPSSGQEANRAAESVEGESEQVLDQMLANTPSREYQYVPGRVLEIPVEGGGKLLFSGRVLERRASFWGMRDFRLQPKFNEIVLTEGALVRDKEVLAAKVGSASAEGDNPGVAIYVPQEGLFVFMLHPIEGAVEGNAEFGQARFKLDGHGYSLFSATPITGGDQPHPIWLCRNLNYRPRWHLSSSNEAFTLLREPKR